MSTEGTVMSDEFTMKIREGGRNGTVTIGNKGITRVIKRTFGKDDRQFIPYAKIDLVEHNRRRMGSDIVTVHVGTKSMEWKVALDAEGFVDAVNDHLA